MPLYFTAPVCPDGLRDTVLEAADDTNNGGSRVTANLPDVWFMSGSDITVTGSETVVIDFAFNEFVGEIRIVVDGISTVTVELFNTDVGLIETLPVSFWRIIFIFDVIYM